MPISDYMRALRRRIGSELVLAPGVAAIVRDAEGRILLQRRSDNHEWALPAGAIDPGEAPAQALLREVWEETGLRVVPERILGVFGGPEGYRFTYANGDVVEYTVILFECRVVGGTLEPIDGESLELRYFAPEEMPPLSAPFPRSLFTQSAAPRDPLFQWDDSWAE
ncbi:MAG: NUDIX domain-containing protein [Armatimonadetes bacterium]|jgi:8-oxo-dGTP pyrophosphatase MutT (NUDIX family)|nr:NUDIX domain-containing protein [Armatimonadota bacterium]